MVTISEFLDAVLPAEGLYAAVSKKGKEWTSQPVLKSKREVAVFALEEDMKGLDAYYSMASFSQGYHADPSGRPNRNNTGIKQVFRVQTNTVNFRAFWLDIDCGTGKHYLTQKEAMVAVCAAAKEIGLPVPFFVSSGYGLHTYWLLQKQISRQQWKTLAYWLVGCLKNTGLRADYGCTTDEVRLLRVPDTHNHKQEIPRLVRIISPVIKTLSVVTIAQILSVYLKNNNITPRRETRSKDVIPANISANPILRKMWENCQFDAAMGHLFYNQKNKDAESIISQCQQVREGGINPYPCWWAMMTVMNCCPNGREAARKLSQEHSSYNTAIFEDKYNMAEAGMGPASCAHFDDINPGVCPNCPFWNRVVTPAELGRGKQKLEKNADGSVTIEVLPESVTIKEEPSSLKVKGVDVYPLESKEYIMRPGQGLFQVVSRKKKEGETGEPIQDEFRLMESCFWLTYSLYTYKGQPDQTIDYVFFIQHNDGRTGVAVLRAETILAIPVFKKWLFNQGLLTRLPALNPVFDCMNTYISKLQQKIPSVEMRDHFGWFEPKTNEKGGKTSFVIGDRVLIANTPVSTVALPRSIRTYAEINLNTKGSIEDWKTIPRFYEENKILWGQMGIALGFAAPLIKFAPGMATNGIVNFWSAKSGTGKTTLQYAINSIWGEPDKQLVIIQSTTGSRFKIMGIRCNLPICLNEVTNLSDFALSETLFQLSEGREKGRLTEGGAELQDSGSWSTITVMSANNTVFDKMQTLNRERDGEIKRVLEIEAVASGANPHEANDMLAVMKNNFGMAGDVFMQFILNGKEKLIEWIKDRIVTLVKELTVSGDERYWVNTLATAIVSASLSNAAGLTSIDIRELKLYSRKLLNEMRSKLVIAKQDGDSSLGDFLLDSLKTTLVVQCHDDPNRTTRRIPVSIADNFVRRAPSGNTLDVRIELEENMLYIRKKALNVWCRNNGYAVTTVMKECYKAEVIDFRLGSGVNDCPDANTKCYKLKVPKIINVEALNFPVVADNSSETDD